MKTIDEIKQVTDVPAVVADVQGLITYVNKSFEGTFAWTSDEIMGKPLTIFIPRDLHDSHHIGFSRFVVTGKPTLLNKPLKLKALTKDGRVFDAEHLIIAEQQGGQWVFGAVIKPLSES